MNTATPMQSFIEQMRRKSQPQNRPGSQRGYFTEPLYSKYMGNTGMGEDGKLQPKNPTAMLSGAQGPEMVHEGEDMYQRPNGDMQVIPANKSNGGQIQQQPSVSAGRSLNQSQLAGIEKAYNIPGHSLGGFIKKAAGAVLSPFASPSTTKKAADTITPANQEVINQGVQPILETGNNLIGAGRTDTKPNIGTSNVTTPIINTPPPANNGTTIARTVTVPNEPTATTIKPPPVITPIVNPNTDAAGTAVARNITTAPEPVINKISAPATTSTGGTAIARTVTTPTPTPIATEIKAPTATPAATTTTPTKPTSTDYMDKAMARLDEIMQGGSPAQKAIAQKQLNELRSSQGLQQRVAGFESAQAGLRPEAASAQMAMGRAVAGSQLAGAASDIAAAEMKQRETSAQTLAQLAPSMQNMEINKQNQVANMVNQGYTKDQINAQIGTNLSDTEYSSLRNASNLGQTEINRKIAAGDYAGANKLLADAGLPSVDFTKPEAEYQLKQLQQVPDLVEQGLSLEEINSKLGTKLTQADYDKVLYSTTRGQNQISALVSAGDYAGANALLNKAGLASIDFSKVEAGESRAAITDIDNLLESLGDDADPAIVTALTAAKTAVLGKVWKSLGIDTNTMTITNSDGTKTTIADALKNIDNPTEPKTIQTVARITDGVDSWLDAGNGDVVLEQLGTNDSWNALYEKAQGGDSAAATEMGRLLGAAMTNELYVNGSSTLAPNATQKAILEKYGVWHEAKPSTVTTEANTTAIKDKLESGDTAGAQKYYDSLTPAEREAIGNFNDLSASAFESKATEIVNGKNYDGLTGKKNDDPLIQAVMKKTDSPSMSYSNKAGGNDEIVNAPAAGTWLKYKTPDGTKLLKVTYNGYLDTWGSSNRAYLEFTDVEGNVYSTNGNSVDLTKGANTKYKKTGGTSVNLLSVFSPALRG